MGGGANPPLRTCSRMSYTLAPTLGLGARPMMDARSSMSLAAAAAALAAAESCCWWLREGGTSLAAGCCSAGAADSAAWLRVGRGGPCSPGSAADATAEVLAPGAAGSACCAAGAPGAWDEPPAASACCGAAASRAQFAPPASSPACVTSGPACGSCRGTCCASGSDARLAPSFVESSGAGAGGVPSPRGCPSFCCAGGASQGGLGVGGSALASGQLPSTSAHPGCSP